MYVFYRNCYTYAWYVSLSCPFAHAIIHVILQDTCTTLGSFMPSLMVRWWSMFGLAKPFHYYLMHWIWVSILHFVST